MVLVMLNDRSLKENREILNILPLCSNIRLVYYM